MTIAEIIDIVLADVVELSTGKRPSLMRRTELTGRIAGSLMAIKDKHAPPPTPAAPTPDDDVNRDAMLPECHGGIHVGACRHAPAAPAACRVCGQSPCIERFSIGGEPIECASRREPPLAAAQAVRRPRVGDLIEYSYQRADRSVEWVPFAVRLPENFPPEDHGKAWRWPTPTCACPTPGEGVARGDCEWATSHGVLGPCPCVCHGRGAGGTP